MGKKTKIIIVSLIIIIAAILGFFILTEGSSEIIGENDLGYVTKVNYTHSNNTTVKIAVVSGMHSRESLHKLILPLACRFFAFTHSDAEIINYQVKVTDSPEKFEQGRKNGESLVHDYVVSDVAKSDPDLVIIGHDHEPGYGEGYYIATPTMDNASVDLAEVVTDDIGFNFYKRNKTRPSKSTSIKKVDTPLVETGTLVFVYEIPETDTKTLAFIESYRLLDASYNHLKN
ncbi:hypothetical protein [Methanobrevibacter sp.]|uniref:hypothetical protein n=1 Tax=Methanobrevibacter sp. TaxID=66852 RepID=UPI0025FECF09|nr:hypothetical protein [Methanobrevibacter sp.]MBQ2961828.1 hypothetical protein [Methanobrevibacter sp.]